MKGVEYFLRKVLLDHFESILYISANNPAIKPSYSLYKTGAFWGQFLAISMNGFARNI